MTTKANPMTLDAVGANGNAPRKWKKIVLEAVGIILFILFMMPFWMVILNAAKDAKEIIYSAVSWPASWGQMWVNIVKIFQNPTTDYVGAFIDSVIITVISLSAILS